MLPSDTNIAHYKHGPPQLAVIVLSVGAPPELADAVRSLATQDVPLELVVVNSGGGDVAPLLSTADRNIRVIAVDDVLWPGAARNRGIAATKAPFVAFLASDCIAEPGWAAGRLRRHIRGAAAVASAVVNAQPDSVPAAVSHFLVYGRRDPSARPEAAVRYGASYARWLFDTYGLFREDLRIGEDTEFRLRLDRGDRPVWAPEVRTVHRNPSTPLALIRDSYWRGHRQGQYWPVPQERRFIGRVRARVRTIGAQIVAREEGKQPGRSTRLLLWAASLALEIGYRRGHSTDGGVSRRELRALTWMNRGRWERALSDLRAVDADKLSTPHRTLYAILTNIRIGALPEARELAELGVAKWPDNRPLSIRRARLAEVEDPAVALALWDEHIARFGAHHAALAGRMAALIRLCRFDEAGTVADTLERSFPASVAAAWGRVDLAIATHQWNLALDRLTAIFETRGDPVALERKVGLLVAMARADEAEDVARLLETTDLDSYLRAAAREMVRLQSTPRLLLELAERHAGRIAADGALLRLYVNALTATGAAEAAQSLVDGSPLRGEVLRPHRVAALLNRGMYGQAWAEFRAGGSRIAPYGVNIFSALVTAAHLAGDTTGATELIDDAAASTRPPLAAKALLQRRRLLDLEGLRAGPPRLATDPPPALTLELDARSHISRYYQLRDTHARFHAEPSFVLNDAIEVAAAIATAVRRREPLSLIRLGDGEGNLLPYSEDLAPFSELDRRLTARVWWGEGGVELDTMPIQQMLANAIRAADIVGIPDLHRLLSLDRPGLSQSLDSPGKNIRGLLAILDFSCAELAPDRFITSCHVHQSLSSWGLWDLLLPRLAPLSLITCHEELAPALTSRFGAEVETVWLVPPEHKHAGRFASQVPGRHYPDRFEELRRELASIRRGQVVLVAAGVLGKIYCQWIKEAGGIGIDIGSAADAWVGHYTRSISENASYVALPGALEGLKALAGSDPRVASIVG